MTMLKTTTIVAATMLLLQACTTQYMSATWHKTNETLGLASQHAVTRSADWRLPVSTQLFLAKPHYPLHATSDVTDYPRTRYTLLATLERVMVETYPNIQVSTQESTLQEALIASQIAGSRILVYPQLIAYRDQANSEKGNRKPLFKKDTATLQILLVDVYSGKVIETSNILSKGAWTSTSDSAAEQLFEKAARQYVQTLSGLSRS